MANHKVEVTMFAASAANAGLIVKRSESTHISLRMRPNTWSEYLQRLREIAPGTLYRLAIFSVSSPGAAHLVRGSVFDSCRSIEQS